MLGFSKMEPETAVYLNPCSSVHTFGMRFPIDIVCLDKDLTVLQILPSVPPNRLVRTKQGTASILEMEAGYAAHLPLETGDSLGLAPDCEHVPASGALKTFFHWPSNIGLGILWAQLVYMSVLKWQQAGEPLSLGILIYNTLLLVMFLTRRESVEISTRFVDWAVPVATVAASMLFRPFGVAVPALAIASSVLQTLAIVGVILSLASLGRSFGVVPANRKVKISGAYSFVRHPLYSCELVFYIAFIMGHPSLRNVVLFTLILLGQLWRAQSEEKILLKDENYKHYFARVPYRFIPGIY